MDLKNKLTEEEYWEIKQIEIAVCYQCQSEPPKDCGHCQFEKVKQAGVIRKSAEKETDEYIASMAHAQADIFGHSWERLKQLIAAERAERKER